MAINYLTRPRGAADYDPSGAEDLWFLMHQSDNPSLVSMTVTCYCDDSGSHEGSAMAVVGGLLMNKGSFLNFDKAWDQILREFRIDAIHMRDFVRPYGKHVTMPYEMKVALFTSVVKAVNAHKVYSLSVSIPQADFKSMLSMKVYRELMGPYAMGFLVAVIMNVAIAKQTNYNSRIAYLVDKGSQHHHQQMDAAHSVVLGWEKMRGEISRTGALTSDLDDNNSALQAADVVAWGYHRKLESVDYGDEFIPLLDIFKDKFDPSSGLASHPHVWLDVPRDGVQIFADGINSWISDNGEMPSSLINMTKWKV